MGKNKDKRRFIEKPSCWKSFCLLCWFSGFGGVLLATIGALSIYKPNVSIPCVNVISIVIGTIVFLMAITGIRIRSQWSNTLMELRGFKERSEGTSSNDELCKLTEILVGFMDSIETMEKDQKAKSSQNQREILNTLNSLKTNMDDLLSTPSQLTKRLSQQEESIKSILSSLGEIKNLLSQEEKIRKLKDKEEKETTTEEDLKKEIKKEINGNNDRLKYV